jgi:hypothetical protein
MFSKDLAVGVLLFSTAFGGASASDGDPVRFSDVRCEGIAVGPPREGDPFLAIGRWQGGSDVELDATLSQVFGEGIVHAKVFTVRDFRTLACWIDLAATASPVDSPPVKTQEDAQPNRISPPPSGHAAAAVLPIRCCPTVEIPVRCCPRVVCPLQCCPTR